MSIYIQSIDYKIWNVIMKCTLIPMKNVDDTLVEKSEHELNDKDLDMLQLNAKAMNLLYCALDANDFNRISGYISIKEIWDKLKVTYEGINQVKETRINMLVHKYELFQMEQNEIIFSIFTCFTDIINGLKCLDKT